MNVWIPRLATLAAGAALMTACGGGGGSSSTVSPAPVPVTSGPPPLVPTTASPDTLLVAGIVAQAATIADMAQPQAVESIADDGDENSAPVALGPKPADAAM